MDASEDPAAVSVSRLTARRVPSSSMMVERKDFQGLSPYDDDVDDDDRGAGDAASSYDKGPAAIAKWYVCFRLASR